MSNPNALFLLADHIKLSLLERKRAQALQLAEDGQDGHISRSLDQFRDGLEALEKEQKRLDGAGDPRRVLTRGARPLVAGIRLTNVPRRVAAEQTPSPSRCPRCRSSSTT